MNPLLILLIGMLVVVGGILLLRLHAFLALIFGALIVAALTPDEAVLQSAIRMDAVRVAGVDSATGAYILKVGEKQKFIAGRNIILVETDTQGIYDRGAEVPLHKAQPADASDQRRHVQIEDGSSGSLSVGDLIVHHTQWNAAAGQARQTIGDRVAVGFGEACLGIGILIAMAAIIGKCLLDSGAAERIVVSARRAFGESRTPLAFLVSGFVVGIPVFFDTVFYLLMPLGKAMRVRTGKNYLLYILTIVAGATMAHSLVPPTPGPLLVANELGVDLGLMMLGGGAVGAIAVSFGYLYAVWANRRWEIPLRESADLSAEELQAMADRDESQLPPLSLSLLPILLPVVLIAGTTVMDMLYGSVPAIVKTLGNKNIALSIAAVIALLTLAWKKRTTTRQLAAAVQTALSSGGIIILITAAGGAFGRVLRQTDVAGWISREAPVSQSGLGLLLVAFGITMVVRIAQGSATVAMITAVGIVAPLATAIDLPYSPLYLALAIGCGSKPIAWMNDSGFWIISRMSGMTEGETLKTSTVMASLMGVVGLGATMAGAMLLPLR